VCSIHIKRICLFTTSILAYPRVAHNPSQTLRLVDLLLSQPMDAGLLDKLKPGLPPLRKMHRLCSLAGVTYSEFGMAFDSNINDAAHADELESPRASTQSRTFMRSLSPPASPSHGLKDNTPPSPFSAWDAVPLSPRCTRRCAATIVSNPPLRPAHYLMFDLLLLPGCLATLVPVPPRVRHATPACPPNRIQLAPPPCGAIPAQSTSTPSPS